MKILALESSAKACSVALCEEQKLIAQTFLHNGFTHSKTLLPAVTHLMEQCELSLEDIDVIACAVGPGSFTGLRIGVSTAKGLAFASEKTCAACSTLASMAWQLVHLEGYTIVCVMDARKNQVYHSRFLVKNGLLERLTEDSAISIEELSSALEQISTPKILIGDGAVLCSQFLKNIEIAPPFLQHQTAFGVAQEAVILMQEHKLVSASDLMPEYHRLSQAERERLEKSNLQ